MIRSRWWLMAVPLALAACAGSLFQTKAKPPNVYLLSASQAGAGATPASPTPAGDPVAGNPVAGNSLARLPIDLAILKPRVRPGLETDHIAALYPDRRLDYFADARWSGPLDEVLQDLAVQVFHERANLRNVSGDASAFASTHWLEIVVVDFQAEYAHSDTAPAIHVHLQGRVGSSSGRRVLGRCEADAKVIAADNRMSAIVAAYEHAADQALAEIAVDAVAVIAAP